MSNINRWRFAASTVLFVGTAATFAPRCQASGGPSQAGVAAVPATEVKQIRLWDARAGDRLTLRSDGTAFYFGVDRHASPGAGEYRGTFPPEDFRRLARAFITQGYFKLKEDYSAPPEAGLLPYSIVAVKQNGHEKLVLANDRRGPAALSRLKSAVREAATKVTWRKGPSGVLGRITLRGGGNVPPRCLPLCFCLEV